MNTSSVTRIAYGAAVYVVVGGLLSLMGWVLDVPRLSDWVGGGIAMKANAASCAILAGCGLFVAVLAPAFRQTIRFLGLFVAAIGSLTLFQHVSGVNLGIDTLLFHEPVGAGATASPGRMGPPASTSFTLAGIALILITFGTRGRRWAGRLGLLVTGIASLALMGYLYGVSQLYNVATLTGIALQTATMIAALGVGLMAAAPEHGLMALLQRDDPGGMAMRRLILPVILLPIVVGWLRVWGERLDWYDAGFGVAARTLIEIVFLLAILWWAVRGLSDASRNARAVNAALEASEDRYRRLVELAPVAVYSCEAPSGLITFYNGHAQTLWGRAPNLGDTDDRFCGSLRLTRPDGTHLPHDQTPMAVALREGKAFREQEVVIERPDGTSIHVLVNIDPICDSSGKVLGAINAFYDITNRKNADKALRASERRYRSLLQASTSVVWTTDANGCFVTPQPSWTGYTGQTFDECRDFGWAKALHPEDRDSIVELWNTARTSGSMYQSEGRIWHAASNGYRYFEARAVPMVDEDGRIEEWIGTCTDVDERKRAEDALKEVDRRKDVFLATLAHELRNPLAPIRTSINILERSVADPAKVSELTDVISRQLSRLILLIDDLLDVSRIRSGKVELRRRPVELGSVMKQAIETSQPLADGNKNEIEIRLPDDPIYVDGDPLRLTQVFNNLINNACKFTDPGGKISLTARKEEAAVVVSVLDNGVGIAPDKLSEIFEMFSQVDRAENRVQDGLGIGLSLAQRMVELHGGSIAARSDGLGRGSEFTVRLPVMATPQAVAVDTAGGVEDRESEAKFPKRRVLVVDDNVDAARTLAMMLQLDGHEAEVAHDGEQAIVLAEESKPEIIFLDIGMPRISGYEVCRAIREKSWGKEIMLVALTGWGQKEDRKRSLEAGFDKHLVKPVELSALQSVMNGSEDTAGRAA